MIATVEIKEKSSLPKSSTKPSGAEVKKLWVNIISYYNFMWKPVKEDEEYNFEFIHDFLKVSKKAVDESRTPKDTKHAKLYSRVYKTLTKEQKTLIKKRMGITNENDSKEKMIASEVSPDVN